ncbi:MAG: inositol monophosphatase, partial [Acidobacteria bacterium]|nr:inositol monophosphatase [Acidobacteriota bacterium]
MPERDRPSTEFEGTDPVLPSSHATKNKKEHSDLALLEGAVRAGGAIALKYYQTDYKRWSKEGGSPVTEADLAVNSYLHDTLTAARPDYGWLSEESADNDARLPKSH